MMVPTGLEMWWSLQACQHAFHPHQGHRRVMMALTGGLEDGDGAGGPVRAAVFSWWAPGGEEAAADVLEPSHGAAAAGHKVLKVAALFKVERMRFFVRFFLI